MSRCFGIILMLATVLVAHVLPASAQEQAQKLPRLELVAGAGASMSIVPRQAAGGMSVVRPVQYHGCRRECRRCRRDCIADWKWDCVGPDCRRGFTRCMKVCWEDICRECG